MRGALFTQLLLRFGPVPELQDDVYIHVTTVLYRCDVEEYLKNLGFEGADRIAFQFIDWQRGKADV